MPAPYSGQCLCGAVRYRLGAEPLIIYACHCKDCQKRSGSAFGMSMWVPRSALAISAGAPVRQDLPRRRDGGTFTALSCAACTTRLWGEAEKHPKLAVMRPGTLDDTSWVRPSVHLWTRSAQPWFVFPADVQRYDTQPENLLAPFENAL
jgi:hypothetical protein